MEVPDQRRYSSATTKAPKPVAAGPASTESVDRIPRCPITMPAWPRPAPGATTSTSRPVLVKLAGASSGSVAPTTIVLRRFSGLKKTTSSLRLPAEVTTTTPSSRARAVTSSASGLLGQRRLHDQLLLITRAPFRIA